MHARSSYRKKCDLAVSNRLGVTSIDRSYLCVVEALLKGRFSFSEFAAFKGGALLPLPVAPPRPTRAARSS